MVNHLPRDTPFAVAAAPRKRQEHFRDKAPGVDILVVDNPGEDNLEEGNPGVDSLVESILEVDSLVEGILEAGALVVEDILAQHWDQLADLLVPSRLQVPLRPPLPVFFS